MMEKTLVVLLHVNAILFAVPGSRADVKCSSGEQLAEVVLQEGDITMFYTKGRRYKDNMNCTAVYTLGEDCEGAEISCDSFHTRANRRCSKGDYLEISDDVDSERYCRRSGPYYHEPIGDFTLQFISDEKKRGKGMNCYVSCPERGSGSGSGSGSGAADELRPLIITVKTVQNGSIVQCSKSNIQECWRISLDVDQLENMKPGDTRVFSDQTNFNVQLKENPTTSSSGSVNYQFDIVDGGLDSSLTIRKISQAEVSVTGVARTVERVYTVENCGDGCNVLYWVDANQFASLQD